MNDNKDKKETDMRGKIYNRQSLIKLTISILSDSLLKWNELLKEAADTRHHQESH